MATTYAYPGVYIEEITGPGVIVGVGTSTAAFIGPAARGPFMRPTVITTFDEFGRQFGEALDFWPYLERNKRRYFLGHGVQGFFDNGGTRAVIVRVGNGTPAVWSVRNQPVAGAGAAEELFRIEAVAEGPEGNNYTVTLSAPPAPAPGQPVPTLAYAIADINAVDANDRRKITIAYQAASPGKFVPGDIVALAGVAAKNRVQSIGTSANGPVLTLDTAIAAGAPPATVKIAAIDTQTRIRLEQRLPVIQAGSLITNSGAPTFYAIVDSTDSDGFVELRAPFQQADGSAVTAANAIDVSTQPTLTSQDFGIKISVPGKVLDDEAGLSLDPFHSGYVLRRVFKTIRVLPPVTPPTTTVVASLRPRALIQTPGVNDDPTSVGFMSYRNALARLQDVDDVNIVCAPDAANDPQAQQELRQHCLTMKDRIAVLDVPYGLSPANSPSALDHEAAVEASGGFTALYYPWLIVPDPVRAGKSQPSAAQPFAVPPSGHIAGVYARIDESLGVHTPPANTEVRGVMGLERRLSDREQGLINLKGVNALRIFPGEGRVLVWGARTTAPQGETDWTYVNVRRLLLYIEESIQEGIRWAVFKPNDHGLWQSLKRTIGSFLDRVWKDGGLVGLKREQAYQVRIDEGLNPPDEIALGRLHIEIKVAPVRPAEFIIVRIGLWDGGAQVTES